MPHKLPDSYITFAKEPSRLQKIKTLALEVLVLAIVVAFVYVLVEVEGW